MNWGLIELERQVTSCDGNRALNCGVRHRQVEVGGDMPGRSDGDTSAKSTGLTAEVDISRCIELEGQGQVTYLVESRSDNRAPILELNAMVDR